MKRSFPLVVVFAFLLSFSFLSSCDKLPEDVDVPDIPAYYFENKYLDKRVEAVNEAINECSDGCESFFWIICIGSLI